MPAGVFVAVVAFDMQDAAQQAAINHAPQFAHARPEAFVGADAEQHARLLARIHRAHRIGLCQREWLFAKHGFARLRAGDDLLRVQRMRRGQHHRLHARIKQRVFQFG